MKINFRLCHCRLMGIALIPVAISYITTATNVKAQSIDNAVIFDPPTNIRETPNGAVICSVKKVTTINIYGSKSGWYVTDICGQMGYIHSSQIRLQSSNNNQGGNVCEVVNIKKGQLALRVAPNGKSKAGLNNGNTVRLLNKQGIWDYVRVIHGPNGRVNGLEGWVNSNYLNCYN